MKFRILFIACTILTSINFFGQNYVYQEEFSDQGTWTQDRNSIRELYTSNGRYYFSHKKTDGYREFTTRTFSVNGYNDFEIETSIQKISGVDNYGISFLYDYKDQNNYKEFGITSGGYFRVAGAENGTYKNDKSWTTHSALKKGNYAINDLKIKKSGSTISFYINDNFVHSMTFSSLIGNKIAFRLYRNQKISIDYIRVTNGSGNNYNNNNYNITNNDDVIFNDDFSSNSNSWSTKYDNVVDISVSSGKYYFEYKQDAGYSTNQLISIDRSRDYKIEANIQKISGVDNYGYGLIFGRTDGNNQNQFQITSGGSFKVVYYDNGEFKTSKAWTKSTAIRTGNYATNKLTVKKIDSRYEFYINDTRVHTDYSMRMFGDRQGFIVFNKQKIAVDDFSVSYIDQQQNNNYNSNSDIVLQEDFNDNANNWTNSENENYRFKVEYGKFNLKHKRNTSGYSTSIKKYINTSKDFEIETKIQKVGGVNNYAYGIMWGGNQGNDFRFYIASSGYYKLVRIVDDKEQVIKKWTTTSAVNKNNGATNILKVKKIGHHYNFYVNDTFVDKTVFENFYGNEIGFVIYNQQEISADYLNVKYLEKNNNTVVDKKLTIPLREDFSNNANNWYTGNLKSYMSSVTGGQLVIERKEKGGIFIDKEIRLNDEKDFVIETSITDVSSASNGYYGFTFGRKNSANEYTFLLSKNGTYKYRKFENDVYTEIIKNTYSDAIKTGYNAVNVLKIEKAGNLLRFYINDQYLTESPFQSFYGDNFGYTVYHDKKIAVNYLDIKYRSDDFNNPPEIVITSPDATEIRGFKIVEAKRIEVTGVATDSDGIFEITINGVEANVTGSGTFTANVPLKYGDNDLVIKATDLKQASSIKKFVIKRKSSENNMDVVDNNDLNSVITGKYHALIIGVGDYDDDILDLDKDPSKGSPTVDAQNLYNVLTTKYNFDKSNVVYLKNPTENEINKNFIMLRSKVKEDDSVLIFYAGHGYYDTETERGYWMPKDFEQQFEQNIVLNTDIVNHIAKIPSKHTLLISDSCFSGSIFNSSTRGFTKTESRIKRIFELKSRKAMTSGTLKTVPNKSMFFKYLYKSLDENQDKYLTSRKLFDLLIEPVMDLTANTPQSGTIYNTGHEGGDFVFVKRN